jgi:hypothetical protein
MLARQEPTDNIDLCTVCGGQLVCDPDSGKEVYAAAAA